MLDEHGREVPDPMPVAIPVQFQVPESLEDRIKRIIHSQLSVEADAAGFETFEEADDFDVGDDYDPRSPHELDLDQEMAELPTKSVEKPVDKPVDKDESSPPNTNKGPPST